MSISGSLFVPVWPPDRTKLRSLTVILTDLCNFRCSYCYEPRGRQRLDPSVLFQALDFFHPFMAPDGFVAFYGGEPLLEFDTLKRAVERLEGLSAKRGIRLRYSLSTNGSLLAEDVLDFLAGHRFHLMLSFDGLAQDLQRKSGTYGLLASAISRVAARPGLSFETNSVFSADHVGLLAGSVRDLIRLGVTRFDVNLAHEPPWTASSLERLRGQLRLVGDHFLAECERLSDIPWIGFGTRCGGEVHACTAGRDQMALSAQGEVWGCPVFPHYFAGRSRTAEYEKYCFGLLASFVKDPRRIYADRMAHYFELGMDRFATPAGACRDCEDLEGCWACPLAAALSTGEIGRIPDWSCRASKIFKEEKRLFLERFEEKHSGEAGPAG